MSGSRFPIKPDQRQKKGTDLFSEKQISPLFALAESRHRVTCPPAQHLAASRRQILKSILAGLSIPHRPL
jgi:hypothetical protein